VGGATVDGTANQWKSCDQALVTSGWDGCLPVEPRGQGMVEMAAGGRVEQGRRGRMAMRRLKEDKEGRLFDR